MQLAPGFRALMLDKSPLCDGSSPSLVPPPSPPSLGARRVLRPPAAARAGRAVSPTCARQVTCSLDVDRAAPGRRRRQQTSSPAEPRESLQVSRGHGAAAGLAVTTNSRTRTANWISRVTRFYTFFEIECSHHPIYCILGR